MARIWPISTNLVGICSLGDSFSAVKRSAWQLQTNSSLLCRCPRYAKSQVVEQRPTHADPPNAARACGCHHALMARLRTSGALYYPTEQGDRRNELGGPRIACGMRNSRFFRARALSFEFWFEFSHSRRLPALPVRGMRRAWRAPRCFRSYVFPSRPHLVNRPECGWVRVSRLSELLLPRALCAWRRRCSLPVPNRQRVGHILYMNAAHPQACARRHLRGAERQEPSLSF